MTRLNPLVLTSAVLACGETVPENQPPTAVGTIPSIEMNVGDIHRDSLNRYFSDSDGDTLTFAASATDITVAAVSVLGALMRVQGYSVGKTMVTITAKDPDGESATQEFGVELVNRPPTVHAAIPPIELFTGETHEEDLDDHFRDADGDELTYTGSSSDTAIASVEIVGSIATVTGKAEGAIEASFVATDPHGDEIGTSADVDVKIDIPRLIDNFDSLSAAWKAVNTTLKAEDGKLVVAEPDTGNFSVGYAHQELDPEIQKDWSFKTSVASDDEEANAVILLYTGHSECTLWAVDIYYAEEGYVLWLYVNGWGWWDFADGEAGVEYDLGEYTDIQVSLIDHVITFKAGNTVLYSENLLNDLFEFPTCVEGQDGSRKLVGVGLGSGSEGTGNVLYDMVEVRKK